MKKRILHISKYYHPEKGGIETVAKYLAEGLTDFENEVVCFYTDGNNCCDVIEGIKVHRISTIAKILSQDISFSYYFELKKILKNFCPDIICLHCPNPFLYPIVKILMPSNTKLVLLWHSDILNKGLAYKIIKPIETMILKLSDKILVTSPNYVHPSSPVFQYKNKIDILPNGIMTSDFELKRGEEERILELRNSFEGKKMVLFVGRHTVYKGIDLLIESEKYVKSDCVFIIAGSGPLSKELYNLVKSPRIKFLGPISIDDLRCYYHAADIFALTSISKQEAFCVALAEAMYCGCVPVVFDIEGSGVNWVSIKEETGKQVPMKDVRSFAKAVDEILSDDALRAYYQKNAKDRVLKNFTDKIVVKKAAEFFSQFTK